MSPRTWILVWEELRMQLRQPMVVLLVLLGPVLACPGFLAVGGWAGSWANDTMEGTPSAGESHVIAAPQAFAAWMTEEDQLSLAAEGAPPLPVDGPIPPGGVHAELTLDEASNATIRYRVDLPTSRGAAERIDAVLRRHQEARVAARFADAGAPFPPDEVVVVEDADLASEAARAGQVLGAMLPGMVAFVMLMTGLFLAYDLITGEKERGTAETLLTAAITRTEIMRGKLAIVVGATILSGWMGVGSTWLATLLGLRIPGTEGGLEAGAALLMAILIVPLALQISGTGVVIAAWAEDYKSASILSFPAMLIVLGPTVAGMLPGIELTPLLAVVPVANVAVAFKSLLTGTATPPLLLVVALASVAHAAGAAAVARRLLGREEVLLGGQDPRALGYHGRDALLLWVFATIMLWFFGNLAQSADMVWGMAFTQVVLFAGSGVATVWYWGLPLRQTLSLRAPTGTDAFLALTLGLAAPGVGTLVMMLQAPVLPVPDALYEQMSTSLGGPSLPVALVAFAVLPGICEELLFRGAILGLFRKTLPWLPRALVVALLFGLLHLSWSRILPTAAIGLVAAIAVLRSRSLWTAVVIHIVNNGVFLTALYTVPEVGSPAHGGAPSALIAWVASLTGLFVTITGLSVMGRTHGPPD